MRIKMGDGLVAQVAQERHAILVNDVTKAENYIDVHPGVRSELAVPLIVKNRVIGVIDIQSEQTNYFSPEHMRLLQLTASRFGQAIEDPRYYTRVARQAQTLEVLNEISRELTSILDVDALLERVGQLLRRIIDFQMFSVWLLNENRQVLENRYAVRFGERFTLARISPCTAVSWGCPWTSAGWCTCPMYAKIRATTCSIPKRARRWQFR